MANHIRPPQATLTLERARRLRRDSTDAERKLWSRLRSGQLKGLRFRRQHPIPPYFVDFCCISARMVIELDGSQHSDKTDAVRTASLQRQGFTVLRFWDNDVLQQTDAVLEAILNALPELPLTPTPLPMGEGLKPSPTPLPMGEGLEPTPTPLPAAEGPKPPSDER